MTPTCFVYIIIYGLLGLNGDTFCMFSAGFCTSNVEILLCCPGAIGISSILMWFLDDSSSDDSWRFVNGFFYKLSLIDSDPIKMSFFMDFWSPFFTNMPIESCVRDWLFEWNLLFDKLGPWLLLLFELLAPLSSWLLFVWFPMKRADLPELIVWPLHPWIWWLRTPESILNIYLKGLPPFFPSTFYYEFLARLPLGLIIIRVASELLFLAAG